MPPEFSLRVSCGCHTGAAGLARGCDHGYHICNFADRIRFGVISFGVMGICISASRPPGATSLASSFETHRVATLLRVSLRMRSQTLMVRSASSRVSTHEATAVAENDSGELENGLSLRIGDQPRKTLVHMVLMMAMEQRAAGIIGDKRDLRRGVARHADGVLHQP